MDAHLGYARHDRAGDGSGNSRNGHRAKTVLTGAGPVEVEVPRDRASSFEPVIVPKRQRRMGGIDDIVVSLVAKGLTTGEVQAHLAEIYGAQVSREIRERGYQGSSNLLVRYINQGRLDSDRPHLSPRRATRILLTRPDHLTPGQHETLAGLEGACPEMTALAGLIRSFAALLAPDRGNDARLRQWIADARAADLPHVHSFTRGLDLDIQAATAALTTPHHNGRTEGVNTRTKMIKRQMYGRAGFTLLHHRILLN